MASNGPIDAIVSDGAYGLFISGSACPACEYGVLSQRGLIC